MRRRPSGVRKKRWRLLSGCSDERERWLKVSAHEWKWFSEGRVAQVSLTTGDDIANLAELDRKHWFAISMPVKGVRFDSRMLELMDTDCDGRIRTAEVVAAIDFLKSKNVDFNELFKPSDELEKKLADVTARQADLAKEPMTDAEKKALADWEAKGTSAEVAVCGAGTAAADDALAAVEGVIDAFFTPPDDMPLVTDEADKSLPLKDHLNPKHLEAILAFAEKCVKPVLGDRDTLDRLAWKKVKAAFAPYRAWKGAKPVAAAGRKAELVDEERVLRYKLHLLEFLENYVNMKRLYEKDGAAVFQTGVLRIDAKEIHLCFHVESEAAHSALAEKSKCCVLYLKLSRPSDKAERAICAVVTAGAVGQLYVGRNGVFYDRDGKDWEAVVTKIVENQVSLAEAFWAPWKKLGEGIAEAVKKFLGDRQTDAQAKVAAGTQNTQAGGAAMASSVAAIGIGVAMVGSAVAAIAATVKGMNLAQMLLAIACVILVVSLPSVILTWFKLRQRDLGAILNASGWAINRPMHFSCARARAFTKCARNPILAKLLVCLLAIAVIAGLAYAARRCAACRAERCDAKCEASEGIAAKVEACAEAAAKSANDAAKSAAAACESATDAAADAAAAPKN